MAKRESIDKVARSTHNKIVKHLSGLGISVGEIDGPSNEAGLYSLQAMQAIEAALDSHNSEKSAQAEKREWGVDRHASIQPADTMDSPTTDSKSSKTAKGL